MKLFLASSSPRRRELLQRLQIPFEVIDPHFEETPTDFSPGAEALYFAEQKARSVANDCPNSLILASDTLVALGEKKLGKPADANDAIRMLQELSGKTHQIYTAIALLNSNDQSIKTHLETASVTFRTLLTQEIADYVATGEPLDKAGAYAIQGGAKNFATKVDGDLNAVIGLPLEALKELLQ